MNDLNAAMAGRFAKSLLAKKLILTHFSARTSTPGEVRSCLRCPCCPFFFVANAPTQRHWFTFLSFFLSFASSPHQESVEDMVKEAGQIFGGPVGSAHDLMWLEVPPTR